MCLLVNTVWVEALSETSSGILTASPLPPSLPPITASGRRADGRLGREDALCCSLKHSHVCGLLG